MNDTTTSPSPDVSEETPIMLYSTARGYNLAAKMIFLSEHRKQREIAVFLPMQLLVGFSIELFLKSWLRSKGHSGRDLRKSHIRHSLKNLYVAALTADFPRQETVQWLVQQFDGPHARFEYRYATEATQFDVHDMSRVFATMDELDVLVDREIGASESHGLLPGH